MSEIKGVIANIDTETEHWTDEAVASLVGQRPTFAINGDFTKSVGRGTVIAAERRGNDVVVTYEIPERAERAIKDLLGANSDGEPHTGIGYSVARVDHLTGDREGGEERLIREARLHMVTRPSYPPAEPAIYHSPTHGKFTL